MGGEGGEGGIAGARRCGQSSQACFTPSNESLYVRQHVRDLRWSHILGDCNKNEKNNTNHTTHKHTRTHIHTHHMTCLPVLDEGGGGNVLPVNTPPLF